MMSWVDVGGMVENVEAAEGQSDKIVSDIEMCMKKRCVTEFLQAKKLHPLIFIDA